jgi:hypothetical protein
LQAYIVKDDFKRVVMALKPSTWHLFQNIVEDDERLSFEKMCDILKSFEAGSFDFAREAFNVYCFLIVYFICRCFGRIVQFHLLWL